MMVAFCCKLGLDRLTRSTAHAARTDRRIRLHRPTRKIDALAADTHERHVHELNINSGRLGVRLHLDSLCLARELPDSRSRRHEAEPIRLP
jgi:hypothetical protein